jgi:hypothetical protein
VFIEPLLHNGHLFNHVSEKILEEPMEEKTAEVANYSSADINFTSKSNEE